MEKQRSEIKRVKLQIAIIIGIIMLVSIIIVVFLCSANRDYNKFVDYVDTFCENWNGLIKELDDKYPDETMVEGRITLLAVDLQEISGIYDKTTNKEKLNEYLASYIDQYMFHQAIEYIKDDKNSDFYKFSDELYRFYEKPVPFKGLEISNIEFYSGTDGYVHCTCSVTNNGTNAQRYMQVTIYFRDEAGNILDYDRYGLIGGNDLEVGNTNKLDFNSYIKEDVTSCDMVIDYQ